MVTNIPPHGGKLINRWASMEERERLIQSTENDPVISLNAKEITDLELIADGAVSPLTGFMCQKDYEGVVQSMRLANGLPWSVPITLSIGRKSAASLEKAGRAVLTDAKGSRLAILKIEDIYSYDKSVEARNVYRTNDEAHPGVADLYRQEELLVGGDVTILNLPGHGEFEEYYLKPAQTRDVFRERGWSTIVGFQTRNPIHRAHEYLQKCALEITDGLLVHPLVGETKSDDIPASVRMRCYEVLLRNYYPLDRTLLAVNPASMRYAGPREAIFHAIIRKNYGCTHFIVGRDHAGVGKYYGTYDAQKIFDEFSQEELGIVPLKFEHSFWCKKCEGMASAKTCPHDAEWHVALSGTKVREMLRNGETPPMEFTRPEVARILIEAMQGKD
jgi:sulfate adenylyltransferase